MRPRARGWIWGWKQPVHVTGHGWLLRELMSNLVDNAIKYTRRVGWSPCAAGSGWCLGGIAGVSGSGRRRWACPESERSRVVQRVLPRPARWARHGFGLAIADEISQVHRATLTLDTGAQGPRCA